MNIHFLNWYESESFTSLRVINFSRTRKFHALSTCILDFFWYVSKHSLTARITDLFWETESRLSLLSTGNCKCPWGRRSGIRRPWSSGFHCHWNRALPSVVKAWLGRLKVLPPHRWWRNSKTPGSFQENVITLKHLCIQQINLLLLTIQAFLIFPHMELLEQAAPVLTSDTEVDASSFSLLSVSVSMFPKIIFFKICWLSAMKWCKDGDGKSHQNIVATVKAWGKLQGQVKHVALVLSLSPPEPPKPDLLVQLAKFSHRHLTRCASLQGKQ